MCGANNFLNLILRCHLLKKILSEINFFWSQKKVSCLKQGSKMNGFCLKEGQDLKALAAHPHPNFPSSAPHPPPSECLPHKKKHLLQLTTLVSPIMIDKIAAH